MAFKRVCTFGRLRRLVIQSVIVIYLLLIAFAIFNRRDRARYTIPDAFTVGDGVRGAVERIPVANWSTLLKPFCRLDWKSLKLHEIDTFTAPSFTETRDANPLVRQGGQFTPDSCTPFQRVAIIIPYRNRERHLRILLKRLHPMFITQRLSYRIFTIDQAGTQPFNRGMLLNVGFTEASKIDRFDCFIFHDVDLVPEHDKNVYLCDNDARHISSAIDELRYHVMYYQMVGGVLGMNAENLVKVNGYSNLYWGWGQEDDDLSARTLQAGLQITRPPEYIGRYKMVRHEKHGAGDGANNNEFFLRWRERWRTEGLNSLAGTYRVLGVHEEGLYTNISVDLGRAPTYDDVMKMTASHKTESFLWYLQFYFP